MLGKESQNEDGDCFPSVPTVPKCDVGTAFVLLVQAMQWWVHCEDGQVDSGAHNEDQESIPWGSPTAMALSRQGLLHSCFGHSVDSVEAVRDTIEDAIARLQVAQAEHEGADMDHIDSLIRVAEILEQVSEQMRLLEDLREDALEIHAASEGSDAARLREIVYDIKHLEMSLLSKINEGEITLEVYIYKANLQQAAWDTHTIPDSFFERFTSAAREVDRMLLEGGDLDDVAPSLRREQVLEAIQLCQTMAEERGCQSHRLLLECTDLLHQANQDLKSAMSNKEMPRRHCCMQ